MQRAEWATTRDNRNRFHSVTFPGGPNVHELTAACGLTDRFWPRIGIRITDTMCETCWQSVVAEEAVAATTPSHGGREG